MGKKGMNLYLSDEARAELERMAKEQDRSCSWIVEHWLLDMKKATAETKPASVKANPISHPVRAVPKPGK